VTLIEAMLRFDSRRIGIATRYGRHRTGLPPRSIFCGAPAEARGLSDEPLHDAAIAQRAYDSLVAAVEKCARGLGISRDTAAIVDEITKTMNVTVPPQGLTVLQTLCDRESGNAFNQSAAEEFPEIRQTFEHAIQDFVVTRGGRESARKVHKIERNAWKVDPGAERRTREMAQKSPDQWRSPYKGRPERYDPGVVLAFATAIARAFNRPSITWTRGTGTKDHRTSGDLIDVLCAAVYWAMCMAWLSFGGGNESPSVKAEGLIKILKAQRR
jgi:hypothetical protein